MAENPDHGLITGSVARECWDIHPDDPLSARGTIHWTQEWQRGDWQVRTEARCEMWADATTFHLRATLEAWEGQERVLTRAFEDAIARDHL